MTDVCSRNAPWCPPHSFSPVANTSSLNFVSESVVIKPAKRFINSLSKILSFSPLLEVLLSSSTRIRLGVSSLMGIIHRSLPFSDSHSVVWRVLYQWYGRPFPPGSTVPIEFSGELKDALLTVIRSSTLKTIHINRVSVPIMLFLDINLSKLGLTEFRPNKLDGQSWLLTLAASEGVVPTVSHVEYCVFRYFTEKRGTRFPTSGYFSLI